MTRLTPRAEAALLALILTATFLLVLAAGIYGTPDWSWTL